MTENVVNLSEHSSRHENDALPTPPADVEFQNEPIDELSRLYDEVSKEELGHQDNLRTHLERAAQLAEKLRYDAVQWELFIDHPRWKETKRAPKLKDRDDALRFVIRWLYSLQPSGSKLANKYYKAVAALLKLSPDPSGVASGLKERGIEALAYPKSAARKDRSSAIKERIRDLKEEHGKPKFILKTVSILDGSLISDRPLSLVGFWVSDDANGGRFLVHRVDQDVDSLLSQDSPE